MGKATSKYQVTVPRKIADAYMIRPGDEIDWVPAGDVIHVIPPGKRAFALDRESRLRLFDPDRGWSREDFYGRGRVDRHEHSGLSIR